LVKEADALAEAGFDVQVIGAHWAEWADAFDARLLATRAWRCHLIDWRPDTAPATFWKTRVRHRLAQAAAPSLGSDRILAAALSRVTPELTRAAVASQADLYIAHNLGALPAAAEAAVHHQVRLGFDAEDFHSGGFSEAETSACELARRAERRWLPQCHYVTAASPLIADRYAATWGGGQPVCLLNVFPLAARPASPRPSPPDGPLRLYWFSQTIGANRGLEDIVRAIARFDRGAIELYLRGTWQPGFRDALQRLSHDLGVSSRQIVSLPPGDPDEMVRLSGVTVNNDIALSNKIFTYLLAGIAVVATRTNGQRDVINRLGRAAIGYDAGDVDALTLALRTWMTDRSRLAEARRHAWALGSETFNWDAEKLRFLEVVDDVMRQSLASRSVVPEVGVSTSAWANR
jgi:glycosyltransferase involved in cell wall biosynthesis